MELKKAQWISAYNVHEPVVPLFFREFKIAKPVRSAKLLISALGIYEAELNGRRVGEFRLAPGWTSYLWRLQYQDYDITELIARDNRIEVTVAPGWSNGRIGWQPSPHRWTDREALIALISIKYEDGERLELPTDRSWYACESKIRESELYDGEIYDSRADDTPNAVPAGLYTYTYDTLIPQEGPELREQETLKPVALIKTPAGETVLDFGQNMAGYPVFTVEGRPGDEVVLSFAEILDENDNFYTRNYRTAQPKLRYICSGGREFYKPHHTYQGFRYVRVDKWPGGLEALEDARDIAAVVLNSDMPRIGRFECGNELVNRLYENIVWSQRANYMDVPTDCPQRDERMGWMGDAQMFARAGTFSFDTLKFMRKWLGDMRAEQLEDGSLPEIVPYYRDAHGNEVQWIGSSAWADACVIIPWALYLSYGDRSILEENFDMMSRWIDFMRTHGDEEYLFDNNGILQFGDWVALDAPEGTKVGATDLNLICSAYYAYSTELYIKAGRALGRDMAEYEELYGNILRRIREKHLDGAIPICDTQTASVLALYFGLTPEPEKTAAHLAELIHKTGDHLITGFIGTAYVMHVLSRYGYNELAYTLLLHTDYPSWLYQVTAGATTVWEHWDGIRPDKSRWDDEMNSFNHYAYGTVLDWIIEAACGLNADEGAPGYKNILFKPCPDPRLGWVKATLDTPNGRVSCGWRYEGGSPVYELTVPDGATAATDIAGVRLTLGAGEYRLDESGKVM